MNNIYFLFKNIYLYNNEQAEFRSFRIGQKNNVKIYYNLFKETIITQMWHVLKYKQKIIDEIIGNKPLSENEIMDKLIEKIINENEK